MPQLQRDPKDQVVFYFVGEETVCPRCMHGGEEFDNYYTLRNWESNHGDILVYCDRCDALLVS